MAELMPPKLDLTPGVGTVTIANEGGSETISAWEAFQLAKALTLTAEQLLSAAEAAQALAKEPAHG